MKKLLLTFSLIMASIAIAKAQSRLSYSLLINESASTDNYHQVCVNQSVFVILPPGSAQPPSLPPLCLDKAWKTNITLNTNYEISPRLRFQGGLGYNVMHLDKVNGVLSTARYKVEYLSIPLRVHYIFKRGKVRFYAGAGFRTDIRLNSRIPYNGADILADNSRGISVSLETLLGIEVPLWSKIKLNFEPTYAAAISPYARDIGIPLGVPGSSNAYPYALIDERPGRMGASIGFTFSF